MHAFEIIQVPAYPPSKFHLLFSGDKLPPPPRFFMINVRGYCVSKNAIDHYSTPQCVFLRAQHWWDIRPGGSRRQVSTEPVQLREYGGTSGKRSGRELVFIQS